MSFILSYHRLFKVSLLEDGANRPLPGFAAASTPRTQTLLQNHRLIFKAREAGFELYYQMNPLAADPLLGRITGRERFSFGLFQSDPGFFNRYEPELTQNSGPQLYLDNLTASGQIQAPTRAALSAGNVVQRDDAMKLYPAVFLASVDLSSRSPPTKFTVRDKFDATRVVLETPINGGGGGNQAAVKIDLSDQPAGPYMLETDAPGSSPRTIYVDNDLARARVLGVIDIYWETAQDTAPADGLAYEIRFRKR
jgi:hypothetical protein